MRKMVMYCDPDGIPRAYGVASTEVRAREIAETQLAKYRALKAKVDDPLAIAEYTEQIEEVT